ncbi:MAG TPA: tRNA (guanosine(37)-N1)-methyltransferase TrmD [Pirellulales bacterium]|nr:tRNA (guanosine(37)-N1)-methyltransferase TrmD [Pirellulales bacterium]
MRFDVLTLFPEMFPGYLGESLLKLAIERELIDVRVHDMRRWSPDPKHHKVDDRPFGGGPGMVIRVEPAVESVEAVQQMAEPIGHVILLTPQGRRLDQHVVEELTKHKRLILLCGRYEGFDERVKLILRPDEISIGDYVLNGGEVAAMAVIEAVARLVPGVLGDERSPAEDSFTGDGRLLEFSQYTRPREYRGYEVPEVLLSGNHEAIARWREAERRDRTQQRNTTQRNTTKHPSKKEPLP